MTTDTIDLTPTTVGYIRMLSFIIEGTKSDEDRQWCIDELNRLDRTPTTGWQPLNTVGVKTLARQNQNA